MSNRKQAFQTPTANPATMFIEWKSNDKAFSFYNRETKENVPIPLPFKFLTLDELSTVKGWNDAASSGIYSNEVKYISKEILTVKPFKGNEIAKGLYSDIKEKVKQAGGHYVKSIYIMLPDGSLANVQLKGLAVKSWGEFTNKNKSRLGEEWVIVEKAIEGKKGSVKFTMPEFKFYKSLSDTESDQADTAFDVLEAYLKAYLTKSEQPATVTTSEIEYAKDLIDDDLEF